MLSARVDTPAEPTWPGNGRREHPVSVSMRLVVAAVLFAFVPAHADPLPEPGPQPAPKAAPAPAPAPGSGPGAAPQAPAVPGLPKVLPRASLADVMPKALPPPADQVTSGPAFGGGSASGIVITPPPHPDDQPWPRGMIITPPDVNDPIAIAPDGDGLSPGKPREPASWSKRFTDAVQDGIDAMIELMMPVTSS
jgi:hypothetical protein